MFTPPTVNSKVYSKCIQEYHVWSLALVVGSGGKKQLVPGFGGFISATGVKSTRTSTIDFTPINQPFTEASVIRELLRRSEDATMEVGQAYVLNTFDLGGCMKALPLIWKFPDEYKKHVEDRGRYFRACVVMRSCTSPFPGLNRENCWEGGGDCRRGRETRG